MKDLYKSDISFPEVLYIVGPGPQGKVFYKTIPKNAFLIALNKAVMIPDLSVDVWMINHAHQDWYDEASDNYSGMRILRRQAFYEAKRALSGPDYWYYYLTPEDIDITKLHRVEQGLQYGGTVAASAIQIAYHFGARQVILCGIDMSGNGYWDGTINREVMLQRNQNESWKALEVLNPLVQYLRQQKGMRITSISPTYLEVPRCE